MGRHRQVSHKDFRVAERESIALDERLREDCLSAVAAGESVAEVLRSFVKEHDGVDVSELEDRDHVARDVANARHRRRRHTG